MDRATHKIDARGRGVGRLATEVATLLRGKHKPTFAPYTDCGDVVEIYNTAKVRLTGKKWSDKIYYRYTGYPGGIRQRTAEEAHEIDPTFLVKNAVRGMLPDNKLRANMMRRLKLHAESQEDVAEVTKEVEDQTKAKNVVLKKEEAAAKKETNEKTKEQTDTKTE